MPSKLHWRHTEVERKILKITNALKYVERWECKTQQAMFLCMSQTDAYQCLLLNEMLCNILHDLPCYNTASGLQAAGSTPLPRSAHTPSYCYSVYEQATNTHTHTQRYTMFIKHAQYLDYPGLNTLPSLYSTSAEH